MEEDGVEDGHGVCRNTGIYLGISVIRVVNLLFSSNRHDL